MTIRLIHTELALQIGPVAIKDLPLSFLASVDKVALESVSVVVHYFCWTIQHSSLPHPCYLDLTAHQKVDSPTVPDVSLPLTLVHLPS